MSEIKKCFISRWGSEGRIVETDFSQLEVVGAAFLSGDTVMKQDILDGIDSHSQSASWLAPYMYPKRNLTYESILDGYIAKDPFCTNFRKRSKAPRFQLQYGAGKNSISEKCGIPLKAAEGFIQAYYGRYARLKQWQDENIELVKKSRAPTDKRSLSGYPLGVGYLRSATGRAYAFLEQEAPSFLKDKGIQTSFQPTQIKNYPSQGFATGDLVPLCLGELYYALKADELLRDKALLVNTVHDSVVADVHIDVVEHYVHICEQVLTNAPKWLKIHFNIEFDLPINVESSVGLTWGG